MNAATAIRNYLVFAAGTGLLMASPALAQHEEPAVKAGNSRYEVWLALPTWPSLTELQPTVGGSFDDLGFGLGASGHWSYKETANGSLMLGVEGAIMATSSDIPVILDELLARHLYVAVSAKYLIGLSRNVSLDAGFGYHLVDIAQLESDYYYTEFETWEEGAFGPFVGFTWESNTNDAIDDTAVTLGFRAHFLDFGTVHDEEVLGSVIFGNDAGTLDGPIYEMQIGYRWR